MGKPAMPNKLSRSTLAIYIIIALFIMILCTMLGAAMDHAVNAEGKLDIALISSGFEKVSADPQLIWYALKSKDSYAPKMLFFGAAVIGLYALYKGTEEKKKTHRRGAEYGADKWGDKKEMRSLADKSKKPEFKPLLTPDGKRVFDEKGNFAGVMVDNNILLTKEVYLSLNAKQHLLNLNVLIIGGSGAGKTRFYAKPNIMQLNTSYVITDPKGEILQSTGKMLQEAGYELRVFNLIQMEHSNNYNPFHYVYDYDGQISEDNIKKMIDVLFKSTKGDGEKEDFWSQKGQTMLEAITYLLFEESEYNAEKDKNGKIIPETRDTSHLNFFSVTEKMRRLQYPPRGSQLPDGFFLEREPGESEEVFRERQSKAFLCPLDKDFIELEKRDPDSLALRLYKEVRNAPEETGQSFLSSANVKTFMFNLSHLQNLTCCDNIELEKLGDRKTALFIIIPATNTTYNFLAAMMYTQLFDTLSDRANFKFGGTLPVHVRCIMDEFANIGQIPDFDKVIAFVRSMGMSLNVIVQNLAQLKARYEKTWEVITGNCDSTLFLGGQEESTLEYMSKKIGKETIDIVVHNRSGGKQQSISESNSKAGRELMLPSENGTMPITDCLLKIRSHNPFYCTKYPIEDHPNYKYLEDHDKNNAFDVKTIRSVSIAEFEAQNQARMKEEAAVIRQDNEEQKQKVEMIFKRSEGIPEVHSEVILDELDYEEELMYADLSEAELTEEYADTITEYGEPSALESITLVEPPRPAREEVSVDEEEIPISLNGEPDAPDSEETTEDTCHFSDTEEEPESYEDIEPESIGEAMIEESMRSIESYFPDESDYSMDDTDIL